MKTSARPYARIPLIALAALTLLAAMWAGLVRIGWELPPIRAQWVANHGPLMISGFLGILISTERALALSIMFKPGLGRLWPYSAPVFATLGSIAVLVGLPDALGRGLLTLGSLGLVAVFLVILRLQTNWAHIAMGLGSLTWLIGNALWWSGSPVYQAVPWWVSFLVVTIAGERLELSRVLILTRTVVATFAGSIGLFTAGLALSFFNLGLGVRIGGAGLIALGVWLLRFDIARHTIRRTGLTRFIAACLLPGYVWMIFAGGLWLAVGDRFVAGPLYDAMLHSVLLGYVFSMIFGHAPMILPAVTSVSVPYRPAFYAHLVLLHTGLVLRIAGDLLASPGMRMWGGLMNVLAILLFFANTVRAARSSKD